MRRTASLEFRLLALVAVTFVGLLLAVTIPLVMLVYPSFERLEQERAREDLQRVVETLQSRLAGLDLTALDWSAWDESYRYAQGRNPDFPARELTMENMVTAEFDLVMYLDPKGKTLWSGAYDAEAGRMVDNDALLGAGFPPDHPLLRQPDLVTGVTGILRTRRGPMLVAATPIITSARTGPAAGILLLGRLLTPARVDAIRHQLDMDATITPLSGPPPGELSTGVVIARHARMLTITRFYPDVEGQPYLRIDLHLPRDITREGRLAITYALLAILLTGLGVLGVLFGLLHRGVVKPLRQLSSTIVRLGRGEDVAARLPVQRRDELGILARSVRRMHNRIVHHAHYDTLTHLPRRSLFQSQSRALLQRLERTGGTAAVLFLDLDGFKEINDRFGHQAGDRCLQEVAMRLRREVRGYDLVSRLGGDEFALLLEGIDGHGAAETLAGKILSALEPPCTGAGGVSVTGSIGISLYPRDGVTLEILIAHADQAMYAAKQAGKNCCRCYAP